jgi:hypothetical protein
LCSNKRRREGPLFTENRQKRIISKQFKICDKKMTTKCHVRSSVESHSEVKRDVRVKSIKQMSNDEFEKEIVEVRA